LPCDQYYTYR